MSGKEGGVKTTETGPVSTSPCEQRDLLPRCVPQSQTDLSESEGKCLCVLIIQSVKHLHRQECAPKAGHPGKEGQGQAAPPPHKGTESCTPTQDQSYTSTWSHIPVYVQLHMQAHTGINTVSPLHIQSHVCTHSHGVTHMQGHTRAHRVTHR